MGEDLGSLDLLRQQVGAVASEPRLRVIAALSRQEFHVSELARQVGMSRALLYVHLRTLEAAGMVSGRLELGEDGRAVKIYAVEPFTLTITPESIAAAVDSQPETEVTSA